MATVKRYSVARTQGGNANASVVHSISVDPTPATAAGTAGSPANSTGSNNGYHRIDELQMREGKIPTLSYSFGNPGGAAPTGVVNTGAAHDCLTTENAVQVLHVLIWLTRLLLLPLRLQTLLATKLLVLFCVCL